MALSLVGLNRDQPALYKEEAISNEWILSAGQ